jgi:uncharacterized protein YjiS (DUF1127 family)
MKTTSSSAIQPRGPIERSSDPRQHWHQPMLPHERRRPSAAIAAAVKRLSRRLKAIGRLATAVLANWERRARSRRELAELSEYSLRDIGLTRADVVRETSKPFWRD